jgi:hypothetical protein
MGYFTLHSSLNDLIYWTLEFPLKYRNAGVNGIEISQILPQIVAELIVPLFLTIVSLRWLLTEKKDIIGVFTLFLFPASLCAIAMPGKYFHHYFINILPFISIFSGIGLAYLISKGKLIGNISLFICLLLFMGNLYHNYRYYVSYPSEVVSQIKYGPTFVQSVNVAKYLKERTQSSDYIFQWGFEPELYFLADRRCPNPYLVSISPSWSKEPQQSVINLKQSLIDKKPAYITLQPEWSNYDGKNVVLDYIAHFCRKDKSIGYAEIYHCM